MCFSAPAIGCLKSDEDRSLGEEMRGSLGLSHSQGSVGGSVTSLAVTSAAVTGGAGEAPATDFSHLVDSADEDGDDDEAAHSNIVSIALKSAVIVVLINRREAIARLLLISIFFTIQRI